MGMALVRHLRPCGSFFHEELGKVTYLGAWSLKHNFVSGEWCAADLTADARASYHKCGAALWTFHPESAAHAFCGPLVVSSPSAVPQPLYLIFEKVVALLSMYLSSVRFMQQDAWSVPCRYEFPPDVRKRLHGGWEKYLGQVSRQAPGKQGIPRQGARILLWDDGASPVRAAIN